MSVAISVTYFIGNCFGILIKAKFDRWDQVCSLPKCFIYSHHLWYTIQGNFCKCILGSTGLIWFKHISTKVLAIYKCNLIGSCMAYDLSYMQVSSVFRRTPKLWIIQSIQIHRKSVFFPLHTLIINHTADNISSWSIYLLASFVVNGQPVQICSSNAYLLYTTEEEVERMCIKPYLSEVV